MKLSFLFCWWEGKSEEKVIEPPTKFVYSYWFYLCCNVYSQNEKDMFLFLLFQRIQQRTIQRKIKFEHFVCLFFNIFKKRRMCFHWIWEYIILFAIKHYFPFRCSERFAFLHWWMLRVVWNAFATQERRSLEQCLTFNNHLCWKVSFRFVDMLSKIFLIFVYITWLFFCLFVHSNSSFFAFLLNLFFSFSMILFSFDSLFVLALRLFPWYNTGLLFHVVTNNEVSFINLSSFEAAWWHSFVYFFAADVKSEWFHHQESWRIKWIINSFILFTATSQSYLRG